MKILFIGSERIEYLILSHKIEPEYSSTVLHAQNSEEAMTIISNDSPDLIILNWQLPDMNSMNVIDAIRNNEMTKKTPLILKMVGIETAEDEQNYRLAGIDDFIPRPYRNEVLFNMLDKWLFLDD